MEDSLKELAGYRLKRAKEIREKSDYDDFYVAGREEAEEQLENAKYFVQKIEEYVNAVNE